MKQIHVITAILLSLKDFGTDTFSIHNITLDIRDRINIQEYELEYFEDRISHDVVKTYFTQLLDNGILFKYDRANNPNGFWEYTRQITSSKTVTTPTPDPVTTTVVNAMASTVLPTDVQLKIYSYLKNNGPASMKRIQSRLKGYSYTCSEIKDFLDKINLIDPQSSAYPDSQVFTVKI